MRASSISYVASTRTLMICALLASLPLVACSDDDPSDFAKVEEKWMADVGKVSLSQSTEAQRIADGDCRSGTVAGLHVDLCLFKDALSADAGRAAGLLTIGSQTGAAIVRERTLLVVSDPDGVDAHGKNINALTKGFMKPPQFPKLKAP